MRAAPVPSGLPPRPFTTTRAPSRAKSSAISRPIPRPAPVTIAILPSRTPIARSSFLSINPIEPVECALPRGDPRMADHGFWTYAQRDPHPLALVDPQERHWTRGELLAECNRIVHGL